MNERANICYIYLWRWVKNRFVLKLFRKRRKFEILFCRVANSLLAFFTTLQSKKVLKVQLYVAEK